MSVMRAMGRALRPLRPGVDALTSSRLERSLPLSIKVTSPAFGESEPIPAMFTGDGEGRFPGVFWDNLPAQTVSVALLVEDADIPFFRPVTHLIVHSIPPGLGGIEPGAVKPRQRRKTQAGWACGRNFLGATGWTPPSPPPGHGPHRYAFQVFALDERPTFARPPGRTVFLGKMRPHLLAQGRLIGTYMRG